MIRSPISARLTPPRVFRGALPYLLAPAVLALLAVSASGQTRLPFPAVVERPIQAGESHSFTFQLEAGQFLDAVVEQGGIDLVAEVFNRQGEKLLKMDGPDYWLWEEEVAFQAESAGPYRLVIYPYRSYEKGYYRLRIDGPRAVREGDRARIEALREMAAAHRLIDVQGPEAEIAAHLESAHRTWKDLGERRRQAETALQLVDALADLNQMEGARERYREAAGLWQELGLPALRAYSLLQSWRPDESLFPREETLGLLQEGLDLAKASGNRFVEARAHYSLGRLHRWQPHIAAGHLENALNIAREIQDPLLEMHVAYQLAFTYDDLAEVQDALGLYEQALTLAHALREVGVEANALNSLGYLYLSLGESDKATKHLEQAIDLSLADKDTVKQSAALNNLALIYEKLDPEKARGLYERSLALAVPTGNREPQREPQAFTLANLARLDLRAGDPARALERGRQALSLAAGFPIAEIQARIVLGNAHRKAGDLESSRRELETALRISREQEDRVRESFTLPALARTEIQAGNLLQARDLLEAGIRSVESLRIEVAQDELRASFLASRKDTYELYLNTLMALDREQPGRGWDAEALRASERARARSLLDLLTEAGVDVREGADPALVARERQVLAEIEELEQRRLELLGSDPAEARAIGLRLEALLGEHSEVKAALRAGSPRYAALTQPEPLSLAEIQRDVLDGRALLLEYALGEEKSFLWAVTPSSLTAYELPPRAKIEDAARRWYDALRVHPESEGGPQAAVAARQAAGELSEMLLRPAAALFRGQPLLIVKDGALHYLPFGALPLPSSPADTERTPMVARQELVTLPSASVLAVLRRELAGRPAAPKILAVFADPVFRPRAETAAAIPHRGPPDARTGEIDPRNLPRLGFSRWEADAIAALVPEPQLLKALGFQASRAAVTGGHLADYRLVHFATHGLIDSRRPELSTLVLSLFDERGEPQNGLLRLHDIYNLKLQADLVVLSACQTALGQEIRGEGLVGLTRGFMYAGAARVLASLWSVDDRATSVLMERFYRQMISGRLSPAAALRNAQIEMSRDPRWREPYYWAAFVLQGEWK